MKMMNINSSSSPSSEACITKTMSDNDVHHQYSSFLRKRTTMNNRVAHRHPFFCIFKLFFAVVKEDVILNFFQKKK
jgi:hypothetical protein